MKSENRVYLKGFLGADADVLHVQEREVAKLRIATERSFKQNDGTLKKETTWHSVIAFQGSGICQFGMLKKGSAVAVTGRISKRKYTAKDGTEREVTDVVAESLDLLARVPQQGADGARSLNERQAETRRAATEPLDDLPF